MGELDDARDGGREAREVVEEVQRSFSLQIAFQVLQQRGGKKNKMPGLLTRRRTVPEGEGGAGGLGDLRGFGSLLLLQDVGYPARNYLLRRTQEKQGAGRVALLTFLLFSGLGKRIVCTYARLVHVLIDEHGLVCLQLLKDCRLLLVREKVTELLPVPVGER